jgi:hypothetical protein
LGCRWPLPGVLYPPALAPVAASIPGDDCDRCWLLSGRPPCGRLGVASRSMRRKSSGQPALTHPRHRQKSARLPVLQWRSEQVFRKNRQYHRRLYGRPAHAGRSYLRSSGSKASTRPNTTNASDRNRPSILRDPLGQERHARLRSSGLHDRRRFRAWPSRILLQ